MADKNAEVAVEDNGGMKKTLSLWNFFTIGFGAIIGNGWGLQVGDWIGSGGGIRHQDRRSRSRYDRIPLGCNLPRARRSCFR